MLVQFALKTSKEEGDITRGEAVIYKRSLGEADDWLFGSPMIGSTTQRPKLTEQINIF